ncbi:hypothetical protein MMC17_005926 [Xylographa soralifera]|nr:hypothetical protein [Xylographa soralifera]
MSASPPKETEVEQGDPSPDNSDHMDRGDPDAQARDLAFEFEVKEQDRWLPIANGWFSVHRQLRISVRMPRDRCSSVRALRSAPASLLSLLYGSCLLSQWELAIMSRDSPQSISPERRSRDSDSHAYSDANIRNFAPVARIMKTALPDNAKIAKEAKECMQECVSEFISFITSEASEKCQQEKRKTVNGEDILFAMTSLGFENYAEALKIYLAKYRETQSARGDNQNQVRPGSGYGSATAQSQGGPASIGAATSSLVGGGVTGGVPGVASQSSGYPGQQESTTNNLLAAQLDNPDQDPNPYANVYPPGGGHNGTTDEPY